MAEAPLPLDPDDEAEAAAWEDWMLLQADALEQELEGSFDISGPAIRDLLSGFLSPGDSGGFDPLIEQLRAFLRGETDELPALTQALSAAGAPAELDPWELQALLEAAEEDAQDDTEQAGPADA